MVFCRMCGSSIPENVKFCPVCGTACETAQPVPQPQHTEYAGTEPPVRQETRRFPVAALVFALTALSIYVLTYIIEFAEGYSFPSDGMETAVFVAYCQLIAGLVAGICMYRVKGHIITGVSFLVYAMVYIIQIAEEISAYGSAEFLFRFDNFYNILTTSSFITGVLFYILVGLHYVLGGRGLGNAVRIVMTCLLLAITVTVLAAVVYETYDYISYRPKVLFGYAVNILRQIFFCMAVFAFAPLKKQKAQTINV